MAHEGHPRRGARPKGERITEDDIVAAASELLQEKGGQKFTIRGLATRLGTSPMAVYHYFDSKDDILVAVIDELVADMPRMFTATESCRETIREYTLYLCTLARRDPELVRLLAPARLTESGLQRMDSSLGALHDRGIEPVRAVATFNAVYAFAIGQAFIDTSRVDAASDRFWPIEFSNLPLDEFPALSACADALDASLTSSELEHSLTRLLESLGLD